MYAYVYNTYDGARWDRNARTNSTRAGDDNVISDFYLYEDVYQ